MEERWIKEQDNSGRRVHRKPAACSFLANTVYMHSGCSCCCQAVEPSSPPWKAAALGRAGLSVLGFTWFFPACFATITIRDMECSCFHFNSNLFSLKSFLLTFLSSVPSSYSNLAALLWLHKAAKLRWSAVSWILTWSFESICHSSAAKLAWASSKVRGSVQIQITQLSGVAGHLPCHMVQLKLWDGTVTGHGCIRFTCLMALGFSLTFKVGIVLITDILLNTMCSAVSYQFNLLSCQCTLFWLWISVPVQN